MEPKPNKKNGKATPSPSDPEILSFPGMRYRPEHRIATWHPRGILDGELADRIVEFIESEERMDGKTFHRFTDLSGIERIDLSLNHMFEIARRRTKGYRGGAVKSAFYAVQVMGLTVARMYQELMLESPIRVGVFRDRAAAAAWLGVPEGVLNPPKAG